MSFLFSWLLNVIYFVALLVASPWILWSAVKHGKYREGFAQKLLGHVPIREPGKPCVWLHAVSVGEVNLLATAIAEIKRCRPDWKLVISTTTKAGYDLANRKYGGYTVFYCPLDFSWAVRSAMMRVRPDLLVLVELELWPNLIWSARYCGARIAIINGRLSDRSFRGYRRLKPIVSRLLGKIDLVAAQNEETTERFCQLGVPAERVTCTGSLKFEGAEACRKNRRTVVLRRLAEFAADDIVWVVGSTQAPEEQYALDIFQALSSEYPRLRLVVVPRHPERFDEVARLLEQSQLPWIRRSSFHKPQSAIRNLQSAIILVDTIGELSAWWGTASLGFVGGSFGSRGGQNMLEPAAYGVATCFGPKTRNFRDIVAQLIAVEGAQVVSNRNELDRFVRRVLEDPVWAQAMGQRAQQLVLSQQGATKRTVALLLRLIEEERSARDRAA